MATRKDDNQKTHIESDATPQLDEIGIAYHQSPDIVADARTIIDSAQAAACCAVNVTLVVRNWLLGRRIAEEELRHKERADYGKQIVDNLSKKLVQAYGTGFSRRALYQYLQFYKAFPEIVHSLRAQSHLALSWSHSPSSTSSSLRFSTQ